jgi:hypothetical protein
MKAWIELEHPDARNERHELGEQPLLFGTDPDASLQVSTSCGIAGCHLEIASTKEGVCIIPLVERHGLARHGAPFQGGLVGFGEDITVGEFRLRVGREEGDQQGPNRVLLGGLAVALIVAVLFGWLRPQMARQGKGPAEAPSLFVAAEPCPAQGLGAEERAEEYLRVARAAQGRSVFVPRDGVRAVRALKSASRCFQEAGNTREAREATQKAEGLRERIEERLRRCELGLELAKKSAQPGRALAELDCIAALFEGVRTNDETTAYSRWLSSSRAELERAQRRKKD